MGDSRVNRGNPPNLGHKRRYRQKPLQCRAREAAERAREVLGRDIWELEHVGRRTARARAYLMLRVLVLTWQGLRRNRIPVQAAALTFYSLIGLGPLIALGIMVSGFVVDQGEENMAMEAISKAIAFAAPQLALDVDAKAAGAPEKEGSRAGKTPPGPAAPGPDTAPGPRPPAGDAPDATQAGESGANGPTGAETESESPSSDGATELAPEMRELINRFIEAAQSGTVGVVGSLMLFVIVIQVLSSIEGSFNSLWGVEKGRRLGERIVVYWTFISLGAVVGAASLTLVTLRTISNVMEKLPFGGEFLSLLLLFSPVITFLLLTFLLANFFRFIPNTRVEWRPALAGAALVVLLLNLYNTLSFLYVQRVVDTRSLYGSVGILVVLMIGLYVFWLLILFGGQVTYAVQNADYLTNENAWQKISERTREVVSLGILLLVAGRFREGTAPLRASRLREILRVPSHILITSLDRLCELGYLCPGDGAVAEAERDRAFQPARPLESLTLGNFKQTFECHGNNEGADVVAETVPGLDTYVRDVISLRESPSAGTTLGELLNRGRLPAGG